MLFKVSLVLGAGLLSVSEAIHLRKRDDGPARVVHLNTERTRSNISPALRDRLRKRQDNTLTLGLDNEQNLYFANVTIGTPGQELRLAIDTGSSDLWANAEGSQLCSTRAEYCSVSGTYNANDSSTYQFVNDAFVIQYADGSASQGDYAKDTVQIGGVTLQNVQFGIGYDSSSPQGILGVGYETNEAAIATTGRTYRNVPAQMVEENIIATNAYSLWLNDLDASTGSILFGGVDTAKYTGPLQTVPVLRSASGVYQQFLIGLSGLTAAGQTLLTRANAIPVLLDSGSSLSYLPDSVANDLYTVFNARYDSSAGAAIVSCDLSTSSQTVDFTFSSVTISVPMNELVLVNGISRGGTPICILGISSAGSSTSVLGDTFLRSAYVVYDLDANEISLAQTDFNATGSSVSEIQRGGDVPGATAAASPVTSLAVGTGGARNGGNPTVTAVDGAPRATGVGVVAMAAAGLVAAML